MARRNTAATTANADQDQDTVQEEIVLESASRSDTNEDTGPVTPGMLMEHHDSEDTTRYEAVQGTTPAINKPHLLWNPAMDDALTLTVKQTRSGPEVVRILQSHEAFENFPASIITQGKIGGRLSKLRKAGVNVPKLKPGNGGGFQGQVYVPDVERLNRLLEGEDSQDATTPAASAAE